MKKKSIKYEYEYPQDSLLSTSKLHVPKWYKDAEKYIGGKPQFKPFKNNTIKACLPFLDSLTIGYMITLPMDVLVEKVNGEVGLSWPTTPEPLQLRDSKSSETVPIPAGHIDGRFVWKVNLHLELPRGHSVLITHPLNRYDLPFTTLSGIVDGDAGIYPGNLPFFLRDDFEGLLLKGTPIAQIIPFKRDDWKLEHSPKLKKKTEILALVSRTTLDGWYRKGGWKKKTYE